MIRIPSHSEGRSRSSRTWGGDAVAVDRADNERRAMRTVKSCGPDASRLASSLREEAQATVTNPGLIAGESTYKL